MLRSMLLVLVVLSFISSASHNSKVFDKRHGDNMPEIGSKLN
jgi:hypothetical protein